MRERQKPSTAYDLRRVKHLVDTLASTIDPDKLEKRLIDLCEKWGVEIKYWYPDHTDLQILDYGETIYNLAKHAQAHGSEQLNNQSEDNHE